MLLLLAIHLPRQANKTMKLLKDLLGITRRQRLRRLELQVNQLSETALWGAKNVLRTAENVKRAMENARITGDLIREGARNGRNASLHLKRETIRNSKLIQEVARERGMTFATLTELNEKASIHASKKMLIMDSQLEDLAKQYKDDAKRSQDEEES